MDITADLKLLGTAQAGGRTLTCPDCGNTFSLEVHKRSVFETAPAWICCLNCGSGHESPTITTGLVDAVLAGWTQQRQSADRDMFTAEWRGIVLSGELVPTLDIYQVVGAAKAVHEAAAPEVKRWLRSKKRAAKSKAKAPWRAVKSRAGEAASSVKSRAGEAADAAKAAAISTAWEMQTGGAGAAGKPKTRSRCPVKGCRRGWLVIKTRVHSSTGKVQEAKVRCAVCRRAD